MYMVRLFGCALIFMSLFADLQAGELEVFIEDENGNPVKDAVVVATALIDNSINSRASTEKPRTLTIVQNGGFYFGGRLIRPSWQR